MPLPETLRPLVSMFAPYRKPIRRLLRPAIWGTLRSTEPKSRHWGTDRGKPIDRYYIEAFLTEFSGDIHGTVLEVADPGYTRKFGGKRVTREEVVSVAAGPDVTIIGDMTQPGVLPHDHYDCIILTQTLHLIYDKYRAIASLYDALKPGGVLLVTVPGISQISRFDHELTGDYWRFTTASLPRVLASKFPNDAVTIRCYGNVMSATGLLHGIASEEVTIEELDAHDPLYQVTVAARAVKPASTSS